MITDHVIMSDVLRSSTTTPGDLCVIKTLARKTYKSPAVRSDLGNLVFSFNDVSSLSLLDAVKL